MLIFKDIFSDDELCSDTFPMKVTMDGLILEFTGKYVVRKEGEVSLAGSNPSAEEMDEGTEEAVERGVDIVLNHQLIDMPIYTDSKQFKEYIKEYMKKLAEKMKENGKSEDELKTFKKGMQEWVSSLIKKDRFKNLQFFCGAGENAADGQLAIMEYRDGESGDVPVMMLVRPGLEEEKC